MCHLSPCAKPHCGRPPVELVLVLCSFRGSRMQSYHSLPPATYSKYLRCASCYPCACTLLRTPFCPLLLFVLPSNCVDTFQVPLSGAVIHPPCIHQPHGLSPVHMFLHPNLGDQRPVPSWYTPLCSIHLPKQLLQSYPISPQTPSPPTFLLLLSRLCCFCCCLKLKLP